MYSVYQASRTIPPIQLSRPNLFHPFDASHGKSTVYSIMNPIREKKSWALEKVQDARQSVMNLSSENREDQYWGLDTPYHSRDEWKIELEGTMKEYLFVSPDVGREHDHVFERFDDTFQNINPDDREEWLAEVLCLYIMEPERYTRPVDSAIARAFSKTMMEMPQKWVPFCEVFGDIVRRDFVDSDFKWCNPCPVLMVLLVAFGSDAESNANTERKSQLVHGAAKAVIQLGEATAKYIGSQDWEINPSSWQTNLERNLSPDHWQAWIKSFETFGNDEAQGSAAGADALKAAEVMKISDDKTEIEATP
ncbi:hypothetical protein EKO27_g575 [Xylaria grammica]|uniref:Uncharacterized protein n=1 Tax=Xylaria grammica TaxID=363999 RepID=A0A439DJC1_9PEZI|nr:hypothetical protein EKO27_g575 [Xylaria grammica]